MEYPRIFALVCVSTCSVEFTSDSYTKVKNMLRLLPDAIRDSFEVVRYDPNPEYTKERTN